MASRLDSLFKFQSSGRFPSQVQLETVRFECHFPLTRPQLQWARPMGKSSSVRFNAVPPVRSWILDACQFDNCPFSLVCLFVLIALDSGFWDFRVSFLCFTFLCCSHEHTWRWFGKGKYSMNGFEAVLRKLTKNFLFISTSHSISPTSSILCQSQTTMKLKTRNRNQIKPNKLLGSAGKCFCAAFVTQFSIKRITSKSISST